MCVILQKNMQQWNIKFWKKAESAGWAREEVEQVVRNPYFPEKEMNKEIQDKTKTMKHVNKDSA